MRLAAGSAIAVIVSTIRAILPKAAASVLAVHSAQQAEQTLSWRTSEQTAWRSDAAEQYIKIGLWDNCVRKQRITAYRNRTLPGFWLPRTAANW
jgi:hypothetical protein